MQGSDRLSAVHGVGGINGRGAELSIGGTNWLRSLMIELLKCECLICGTIFEVHPSQLKHRTPKYCSLACYNVARFRSPYLNCSVCGRPFRAKSGKAGKRYEHCSNVCRLAANHLHSKRGKISPTYCSWQSMKRRCNGLSNQ